MLGHLGELARLVHRDRRSARPVVAAPRGTVNKPFHPALQHGQVLASGSAGPADQSHERLLQGGRIVDQVSCFPGFHDVCNLSERRRNGSGGGLSAHSCVVLVGTGNAVNFRLRAAGEAQVGRLFVFLAALAVPRDHYGPDHRTKGCAGFEPRVYVELARLRYRRRRLRGSVAAAVHQHLGDDSRISGAFHGQSGAVDDDSENLPFAPHPAARPFDQGMQRSFEPGDGRRRCLQEHGMGPAPPVCSYLHSGPLQREADRRGATHGWCTTRGGKGSVFLCVRGVLDLLPCHEWRVRTFGRHAPGVSIVQDSHHGLCHHLQLGTSLHPYVCRL
mmetsp:Transcript_5192/g.14634  ORF Transcript_5192/g.14634 Transcript_5192/m.14634 type:complete len:331 (+) Transcript_5192:531-1523(+)